MRCTDKERETCQVEKMGCEGCFYNKKDKIASKKETEENESTKNI